MTGQTVTIRSRKYDKSIRRSWTCRLIEQKGPLLLCVGEFDRDIKHPGLGSICVGTLSYEYYWFDRWFNIFRFHEPDGAFRNYYCNISMPPAFENGVLDYIDLDIDVVIWKDFSFEVLDRDDFEENAARFGYPEHVILKAEESLSELIGWIERRDLPQ